ncbi:MAG: hypothetical protein ACOCT9_02525 [archaeon]
MIDWLLYVVLGILVLASILDIKYKVIPSVLLTSAIFLVLIMRPDNLVFGVLGFVFAYLIKDLTDNLGGMSFGVADIKVFVIIGLLISSIDVFILMIAVFLIFQFVYTVLYRWKISKKDEMPFIPCLTAVYIALMLGGVL